MKKKSKKIEQFLSDNQDRIKQQQYKADYLRFVSAINNVKNQLSIIDNKLSAQKHSDVERGYNSFKKIMDSFFGKAASIQDKITDRLLINRTKRLFREVIKLYLFKSQFARNSLIKPRGYPGDGAIVESMYNNMPVSRLLGLYFDKYFLDCDYVQAVRDRKNRMKDFLARHISRLGKKNLNILNLACGTCRELYELNAELTYKHALIKVTLVDSDSKTLKFAERRMKVSGGFFVCNFVCDDVLQFVRKKNQKKIQNQKYDLIYSIGLADYLPNSILGPLIKYSFDLLEPKGKLIIAHKNVKKFNSTVSDWAADWNFIPRDEEELKDLIKSQIGTKGYFLRGFFESKNRLFFEIITKK